MRTMPKILLAADQQDLLEMMQTSLQMAGHEVITAGDGEAALQAAGQSQPDLIVLDAYLPVLNGLDACSRILENDPQARILLISGADEAEERSDAKNAGARAHLGKPFELSEFMQQVAGLLSEEPPVAP